MDIFYVIKTSPQQPSTVSSSPFSSQSYVPLAEQTPQTPPFNIIYSVPTISQSYTHVAVMKRKRQYTSLTALYLIPLLYRSDTACSKVMWLGAEFYLWCHTFPFICTFFCLLFFVLFYVLLRYHTFCLSQELRQASK